MEELVEENTEQEAALFAALADPTRLRLLKLLIRQRSPDALCVNALAYVLGITQSAASQHLRVLKNVGLVKGKRTGYRVHYSVSPEAIRRYRYLILAMLPADDPKDEEKPK
jgi:DNA-binding transcriptional ArsR family regulator